MAFWNNLVNKIGNSRGAEKIEKAIQAQEVPMTMVPLALGQGKISPIDTMFRSGIDASILREFSVHYPILRMCINYRKRQLSQLSWTVRSKDVILDHDERIKVKDDAKKVKEFLQSPTGDKNSSFTNMLSKLMEDLLILDAATLYRRKNRRGGIYGYLPIDASTIRLALMEDGTTPPPPLPAYYQKIRGQIKAELTTEDLIYKMMNARTHTPYGLSPVESLIITISTALKLSSYQLGYLTAGNIPEGFVELPKDIAGDPNQLTLWQNAWDAMFSGNTSNQRKIKFLPEGMKLHEIKKQDEMSFERFEKWLLLNTCGVMETAPQAIGFQFDRGKGATEAEWEIGKERGLFPMANLFKEIFDEIIQVDLGQPHLEFDWTNVNPTNKKEEADVFSTLVRYGAVSVDEWRVSEGYEPIGLGHYIQTSKGVILVDDLINRTVSTVDSNAEFIQDDKGTMQANAEVASIISEESDEDDVVEDRKEKPSAKKPKDVPGKSEADQAKEKAKQQAKPAPTKAQKISKGDITYEFNSTQFNLNEADSKRILDYSNTIKEEDLLNTDGEKGVETEPHVTIVFGIGQETAPEEIAKIVNDFGPVSITLGKTSLFTGEKTDVLKIDVSGDQLMELNKLIRSKIEVPGETYPDYKPHLTIAYLKTGMGIKYSGDDYFEDTQISFDSMNFSSTDGKLTAISLNEVEKLASMEELKKWKKSAINDFKNGKKFRDFKSEAIDTTMKATIQESLSFTSQKEDIVSLFNRYIKNG